MSGAVAPTPRPFFLRVDTKEQSAALKSFADRVEKLQYENPADPAHPFQFDIELTTACGQVLMFERKQGGSDPFGSFEKMPRQMAPVHALIWEGVPSRRALALAGRFDDPKFEHLYDSTRKRVWRLAFSRAILVTEGVEDTIRMLAYLGGKTEPIEMR